MTVLALCTIGKSDYAVIDDGNPVGRIRLASERQWEMWNCTLPVPSVPSGTAGSFEAAKAAFRLAWMKYKADICPERLAKALQTAQAARGRLKAKGK